VFEISAFDERQIVLLDVYAERDERVH